jgi:hypothetical protein
MSRSPGPLLALLAALVLVAAIVAGVVLSRATSAPGSASDGGPVVVEAGDLELGDEIIYTGDLGSSHGGFAYVLRQVGCGGGVCTALLQATNEGEGPADVETSYYLWVAGERVPPTQYSGQAFTQPVQPGETVELRMRFPVLGQTQAVTRFEIADTVAASGILVDL